MVVLLSTRCQPTYQNNTNPLSSMFLLSEYGSIVSKEKNNSDHAWIAITYKRMQLKHICRDLVLFDNTSAEVWSYLTKQTKVISQQGIQHNGTGNHFAGRIVQCCKPPDCLPFNNQRRSICHWKRLLDNRVDTDHSSEGLLTYAIQETI